jgi:hypothetical protein
MCSAPMNDLYLREFYLSNDCNIPVLAMLGYHAIYKMKLTKYLTGLLGKITQEPLVF